jgi:hypothetical protein
MSGISAVSCNGTVRGIRNQITHSRSPYMYTSETVGPSSAHKVQRFVAGVSVAYAIVGEDERAGRTAVK